MLKPRVLVVDDEESYRNFSLTTLRARYDVKTAADGQGALQILQEDAPFDVVLLDVNMPVISGLEILPKILLAFPSTSVVMVTSDNDTKTVVSAMKNGASDYVVKPFELEALRHVIDRVLKEKALVAEVARLHNELQTSYTFDTIIGSSAAMQGIFSTMRRLLDNDTTVLIQGATGTGKELVARALHYNGIRKNGPFIAVNCTAIPNELLESELFGHEKGSFTGADARRIGLFEAANGGTLFLDEIGDMSPVTQSKLLRVLQEREVRRVGGRVTIKVNLRLICATNRNLNEEVLKKTFRVDLFYRINVVPIDLPALRERREDIPMLATHYLQRYAKAMERETPMFSPAALELLMQHSWPGNVRQLEHFIERLLITCDESKIGTEQVESVLPPEAEVETPTPPAEDPKLLLEHLGTSLVSSGTPTDLEQLVETFERAAITEALKQFHGHVAKSARHLNLPRRVLSYKMKKYGLETNHDTLPAPSLV